MHIFGRIAFYPSYAAKKDPLGGKQTHVLDSSGFENPTESVDFEDYTHIQTRIINRCRKVAQTKKAQC